MKINRFETGLGVAIYTFVNMSLAAYFVSQPDDVMVCIGVGLLLIWVVIMYRILSHIILMAPGTGEPPKRMPTTPVPLLKVSGTYRSIPLTTFNVLLETAAERARQDIRWGEQNHLDFTPTSIDLILRARLVTDVEDSESAKRITDEKAKAGTLSFFDILNEEVFEARDEAIGSNSEKLRVELIQVAAVAISWIEAIDRRKTPTTKEM